MRQKPLEHRDTYGTERFKADPQLSPLYAEKFEPLGRPKTKFAAWGSVSLIVKIATSSDDCERKNCPGMVLVL